MMKIRIPNEEYLLKAELLSGEEKERLLCRMRGKLFRRLEDEKLSQLEAIAIQLEIEDADLAEWRKKMHEIKHRDDRHREVKHQESKQKEKSKKKH